MCHASTTVIVNWQHVTRYKIAAFKTMPYTVVPLEQCMAACLVIKPKENQVWFPCVTALTFNKAEQYSTLMDNILFLSLSDYGVGCDHTLVRHQPAERRIA
jgi:hypothetical protein